MKKVLFLLVSLLGFVGSANADVQYKQFTAYTGYPDGTATVKIDNSNNVTTPDFQVTDAGKAATMVGGDAYIYYGVNKIDTFKVTVNPSTKGEGWFNANIVAKGAYGIPTSSKTQKALLVMPQGFFACDNDVASRVTIYLEVTDSAVFVAQPDTFYLERNTEYADSLVGNVTATVNGVAAAIISTDTKAVDPDGFGYYEQGVFKIDATKYAKNTTKELESKNVTTSTGTYPTDWDVNIPENVFATESSRNPLLPIHISVADSVKLVAKSDTIYNKDRHIEFTLAGWPAIQENTKYLGGDTIVTKAIVNGEECTVTYDKKTNKGSFDVTKDFLLEDETDSVYVVELVSEYTYNNTKFEGSIIDSLVVIQKDSVGLGFQDKVSYTSALYPTIRDVEFEITPDPNDATKVIAGIDPEGHKCTCPWKHALRVILDPTKESYITDGEDVKRKILGMTLKENGKYDIQIDAPLPEKNEYLLTVSDSAFVALAEDTVLYYNQNATLHVNVQYIVDFYDNVKADLGYETTTNAQVTEWANAHDNYDQINYIRHFSGKLEAFAVPFDVKVGEATEGFKFYKFTDVSETDGGTQLWRKSVQEGETLYANKPYLVIREAGEGLDTINIEEIQLASKETGVYCSTTTTNFEFRNTIERKSFTATDYDWNAYPDAYAWSNKGYLLYLTTSNTVSPWRFYIRSNSKGINYSKLEVVDADEATAISTVNVDYDSANDVMYNIAGQRISNPTNGQIVIKNGKKSIVK